MTDVDPLLVIYVLGFACLAVWQLVIPWLTLPPADAEASFVFGLFLTMTLGWAWPILALFQLLSLTRKLVQKCRHSTNT